jgi:hypothetical protein
MKIESTYADFLKSLPANISLVDRQWAFRVWVKTNKKDSILARNLTDDINNYNNIGEANGQAKTRPKTKSND